MAHDHEHQVAEVIRHLLRRSHQQHPPDRCENQNRQEGPDATRRQPQRVHPPPVDLILSLLPFNRHASFSRRRHELGPRSRKGIRLPGGNLVPQSSGDTEFREHHTQLPQVQDNRAKRGFASPCSRSGDEDTAEQAPQDVRVATSLQRDCDRKSRPITLSLAIMPILLHQQSQLSDYNANYI